MSLNVENISRVLAANLSHHVTKNGVVVADLRGAAKAILDLVATELRKLPQELKVDGGPVTSSIIRDKAWNSYGSITWGDITLTTGAEHLPVFKAYLQSLSPEALEALCSDDAVLSGNERSFGMSNIHNTNSYVIVPYSGKFTDHNPKTEEVLVVMDFVSFLGLEISYFGGYEARYTDGKLPEVVTGDIYASPVGALASLLLRLREMVESL